MNANLSIIIATFNSDKTVRKTLDSLVNQAYKNFEVIIVDGLSKDNTVAIIREYEKKFETHGIIYNWSSEKDSGIYDAWNKGLKKASSNWIAFLGSDDTYYPNALETYYRAITNNPGINYISSKVELIDRHDKILKVIGRPYEYQQMNRYMNIAHVGSFHHKDLFSKYGNFNLDYKVVADYDFFLKCGKDIHAAYINEVTAQMLNEGVSNQNVTKVFKEVLKMHLAHKKISVPQAYFEYLYNHIRVYAGQLIRKTSLKT